MLALNPALNAFSPDLVTRLLTDALTALGDIARTSANPVERRRAATTLLRFITARPPHPQHLPRPARDTKAATTPATPAATPTPQPPTPLPPVLCALSVLSTSTAPQRPRQPNPHPRTAHELLARVGAPPH